MFADGAVVGPEGGEEMAVNIQLADDFLFDEDWDDDFGFGFKRAGEIAGILSDVIHHNGLAAGRGRAASQPPD